MAPKPTFTVVYREVGGSKILTEVYVPPTDLAIQASNSQPTEVPIIYVVHGGGWLMGHPRMNPQAQIEDSLKRGWIVVAPDHRLCPQVNILEGPMGDIRAFHKWVYDGHLDVELASRSIPFRVDTERIIATGTASGGHACLGLAYDPASTPPPTAIISYYAPMNFAHPWWTGIRDKLDVNTPELTPEMEKMVFSQYPIPSRVDIPAKPDHTGKIRLPETDPANPTYESARIAYSTTIITRHELLDVS
ncbi:hypothetical protein FSOLCH5_003707 [Fusarium solani]